MVINRNAQGDLGTVLADDILVQGGLHLGGGGQAAIQRKLLSGGFSLVFILDKIGADGYALVTDIGIGSGNQPFHFILGATAKAAAHFFLVVTCHVSSSFQQV